MYREGDVKISPNYCYHKKKYKWVYAIDRVHLIVYTIALFEKQRVQQRAPSEKTVNL